MQQVQAVKHRLVIERKEVYTMNELKPGKRFISINGVDVPFESIKPEERERIVRELTDRSMRTLNLYPVKSNT